ncbi:MAG: hypothetical protein LPL00_10375 [Alphaproteobacteria bacterium]|nr:hypothetical protein [Alphaproteobacteria bacterium]MDX5370080.1 hypothetical protein [Alphaproteobacteria bacterium]MDX5464653.1 hypothetical protein [Alphaproteobacteria bacterium]
MDLILTVVEAVPAWLTAILGLVAAASAITALTPTPRDDEIAGKLYRIVEVLALNIGRAKDQPANRAGQPRE